MATTHYGWNTPTVGGDEDTWGDELNTAIADIDTDLNAVEDAVGWKKLSSGVVSAAPTLDIPLPAVWRRFKLMVQEIEPVTDSVSLQALLAFDAVPTYQTADYRYTGDGTINGVASQINSISAAAIALHGGSFVAASGLNPEMEMSIAVPEGSSQYSILNWNVGFQDGATTRDSRFVGRGRCAATGSRPTYLRLKFWSGNIATARWALFGVQGL